MADKKFAYVSFITNDQWVMGLTLMLHSLASFGTAHDRVVLVTEGVSKASRAKLTAKGVKVIAIETISSKVEGGIEHVPTWTELGYTKLQIWGLTQYDKILYIGENTLCDLQSSVFVGND
jgi:alpha-N-acetylglucosamine transferase